MQSIKAGVCQGSVGLSVIHQWRWDAASLWSLGRTFQPDFGPITPSFFDISPSISKWILRQVSPFVIYYRSRSGNSAESRNIVGIATSVLTTCYHTEETVVARDCTWGIGRLRCGDGMKRVLAVKFLCL